MQINSITNSGNGALQAFSGKVSAGQMHGSWDKGGVLFDSDIAMLKAVTNTEFDWPPKEGGGAPQAAFDLAAWRQDQMNKGSALGKITATDLDALVRRGILDADFAAKAKEYLANGEKSPSTTAPTDLRINALGRPQPGTIGPDGSIYM